jgi:hypothetical protein
MPMLMSPRGGTQCVLAIAIFDTTAVDGRCEGLIHSHGVDLGDSTGHSLKL